MPSCEILEGQINECTRKLKLMTRADYGTLDGYRSETLYWQDRRRAFRQQLKELTQ